MLQAGQIQVHHHPSPKGHRPSRTTQPRLGHHHHHRRSRNRLRLPHSTTTHSNFHHFTSHHHHQRRQSLALQSLHRHHHHQRLWQAAQCRVTVEPVVPQSRSRSLSRQPPTFRRRLWRSSTSCSPRPRPGSKSPLRQKRWRSSPTSSRCLRTAGLHHHPSREKHSVPALSSTLPTKPTLSPRLCSQSCSWQRREHVLAVTAKLLRRNHQQQPQPTQRSSVEPVVPQSSPPTPHQQSVSRLRRALTTTRCTAGSG